MGFATTSTTTTLTAKLTPFGRQQLLANNSSLITHFALGDSDANYNAAIPLASGEIPDVSGNQGPSSNSSNSVAMGYTPRSTLSFDSIGTKKKLVNIGSSSVVNTTTLLGQETVSGDSITQNIINKTNTSTDSLVNLFYSFRLPITDNDVALFTATTNSSGGFADTALSGLAQDEILVVGINSSEYGEMFDGKAIKVDLITTASTAYTMYGTYEKTLSSVIVQDARYKEHSFNSAIFGNNIVFLFSDLIQRPNSDATKSWATGYGTVKPFGVNNKPLFNMFSDTITSTIADKVVGIAALDKGFIIITDPTIISTFDPLSSGGTATTVSFDSVATEVVQEITCIADRNEFSTSTNTTFTRGDTPRISEILLLDSADNIIAVAKPDRHIEKTPLQFLALGIRITV